MTKALAVLAVTAAAVVLLARYDTHPPKRLNAARGTRPVVAAVRVPASGVRPGTPGTRTGKGPLRLTGLDVGDPRLPQIPADPDHITAIASALAEAGVLT